MRKTSIIFIVLSVFFIGSCTNASNDVQKEGKQSSYNVIIQESQNGKISVSKTTGIKAGEEVILSVEANPGYFLKTLTAVNAKNKDLAVAAIETDVSYKFTMADSDVTVSALFAKKEPIDITNPEDLNSANGNTMYRIEHYQQDVDDLNSYTLYAVQRKRGEAGEETEAQAQNYPGFYSLSFAQKTIESDGTTIVEIYYDRKTITYTFTASKGVFVDGSKTLILSGLFGSKIEITKIVKAGYTAVMEKVNKPGYRGVPDSFGPDKEEFIAFITANSNTPYTVRVYYQETTGGDNYFLHHELYKYGTTDTSTNFDASSVTGFILKPYEQKNIEGDESCVLNIYYDRISYTVTYELNGGSGLQSEQLLYGASPSQIPVKEGYTFWDWYYDSECENVFRNDSTQDTTLYAFWQDNSITYQFTDNIIRLPAGTDGTAGTDAEYVLFGDYPQSYYDGYHPEVEMIKTFKIGNITTLYGDDGNLYARKIVHGQENFYKVEPIKWRVISKDENGNAFLFAEKALERSKFTEADFDGTFENSIVHTFLNTDFLKNAFTASARNKIQETEKLLTWYEDEAIFVKAKVHLINERELRSIQNFTWNSFDKYTTAYALGSWNDIMVNQGWFLRYLELSGRNQGNLSFQIYVTEDNGIEIPRDKDALHDSGLYSVIPAITVYLPD